MSDDVKKLSVPIPKSKNKKETCDYVKSDWDKFKLEKKKKILLYHPNESGMMGVKKRIEMADYEGVHCFHQPDGVLNCLRQNPIDLMILWYSTEEKSAQSLLRTFWDNRELSRTAILILCPGVESIQNLAREFGHLFFDRVALFDQRKEAMVQAIEKTLSIAQTEESPSQTIYDLRRPWRVGLPDYDRTPLKGQDLESRCEKLTKFPGKSYWAPAEKILHLLLGGQTDPALEISSQLIRDFPHSFDAKIIHGAVTAKKQGLESGIALVVHATQTLKDASPEDYFRIGKTLAKWKAAPALAEVIEIWSKKYKQDHMMNFLAASYYTLCKEYEEAKPYLYSAVAEAPRMYEYLQALAQSLMIQKDFVRASIIWEMCRLSFRSDPIQARLGCAQSYIHCRKMRLAEELVNKVLAEYPKNPSALALRKKYFSIG